MKKVSLKGFAIAVILTFSLVNISCDQKTETSMEQIAEENLEAAEINLDEAQDAVEASKDSTIQATSETVDSAINATQAATEDVKDAIHNSPN